LFRNQINPDAIAYMRIAHYYMRGQTDLMISGYWGPLLSWLIVPWLLVFDDPLLAAHAAMAVSAVVFLFGCFCVLRAARLPGTAIMIGTWITAVLSVAWSGVVITPDLLMAGLFCCGTSRLLSGQWVTNARIALGAGMVLGVAYLAKAVVLPVSALMILGLAGTHVAVCQRSLRQTIRATILIVAGFLSVAGPWIGMLSYTYGHLVFSTSGPINHALVGPPDMPRRHPDKLHFYQPDPGRITTLEDRTHLPYNYWSPFESVPYAVHQANVIARNAHAIVECLKTFDWFGLGLVSAMFGYLFGTPWRKTLQEEPWRLSVIPIAAVVLLYLPVYVGLVPPTRNTVVERYFWVTFPFLSAASFGFALHVSGALVKHCAVQRALAFAVVTVALLIGNKDDVLQAFARSGRASGHTAKLLAHQLRTTGLIGSVAAVGSLPLDGRYVAYLLNVPSVGHIENVEDPEEILSSGAALVIVPRGTALAQQLREDRRFTSADQPLFGCDEAKAKAFEVFLTRPPTAREPCADSGSG
jgi:hypothetical protein